MNLRVRGEGALGVKSLWKEGPLECDFGRDSFLSRFEPLAGFLFKPRMESMGFVLDVQLVNRLRRIKLLLLDVDGVLTDCRTFLDSSGEWRRFFSIRDGYGIKRLMDEGYEVGIITGTKAQDIQERAKVLKLQYFIEGTLDKKPAFEKILAQAGLRSDEVAYMGDDEFDLPVLKAAGFAATVPEATEGVIESAHFVSTRPGGNGAVRELCELILKFGAHSRGQS